MGNTQKESQPKQFQLHSSGEGGARYLIKRKGGNPVTRQSPTLKTSQGPHKPPIRSWSFGKTMTPLKDRSAVERNSNFVTLYTQKAMARCYAWKPII